MRKTQSFCSVIYAVRARTLYESSVFWGLRSRWGGTAFSVIYGTKNARAAALKVLYYIGRNIKYKKLERMGEIEQRVGMK